MTAKDDGGPASEKSLRAELAGRLGAGMLANPENDKMTPLQVASDAVMHADCLLEELAKGEAG